MSLAKFKTDSSQAEQGVWIDYPANKDGTIPRFLLARMSKQNKAYTKAFRKYTEKFTERGIVDFDSMPEEETEQALLEVFVDTVLLNWENVQLADDGFALPYSRENAIKVLSDPDWIDLYNDLQTKAGNANRYRQKKLEADVKN